MKEMKPIAQPTICKDGTTLSVQASRFHYSTPRGDDGPYSHVEVGFIRNVDGNQISPPETWSECGDGEFPSDVYGYVPVELVEEFIQLHGGMLGFWRMPGQYAEDGAS